MSDQMSPRGGKHPGTMPKPPMSGSGGKGKSPKHQAESRPGYGKGGERGEESSEK